MARIAGAPTNKVDGEIFAGGKSVQDPNVWNGEDERGNVKGGRGVGVVVVNEVELRGHAHDLRVLHVKWES